MPYAEVRGYTAPAAVENVDIIVQHQMAFLISADAHRLVIRSSPSLAITEK